MVRVGAYRILPTNTHNHRQMIDPPDTFRSVCNTPLPVRIKNLILIYWVLLKLGRFLGVCFYDQPHFDGKRLKFIWLTVKLDEDWMDATNATQTPTSDS